MLVCSREDVSKKTESRCPMVKEFSRDPAVL